MPSVTKRIAEIWLFSAESLKQIGGLRLGIHKFTFLARAHIGFAGN